MHQHSGKTVLFCQPLTQIRQQTRKQWLLSRKNWRRTIQHAVQRKGERGNWLRQNYPWNNGPRLQMQHAPMSVRAAPVQAVRDNTCCLGMARRSATALLCGARQQRHARQPNPAVHARNRISSTETQKDYWKHPNRASNRCGCALRPPCWPARRGRTSARGSRPWQAPRPASSNILPYQTLQEPCSTAKRTAASTAGSDESARGSRPWQAPRPPSSNILLYQTLQEPCYDEKRTAASTAGLDEKARGRRPWHAPRPPTSATPSAPESCAVRATTVRAAAGWRAARLRATRLCAATASESDSSVVPSHTCAQRTVE